MIDSERTLRPCDAPREPHLPYRRKHNDFRITVAVRHIVNKTSGRLHW